MITSPNTFKEGVTAIDPTIAVDRLDAALELVQRPAAIEGKNLVWLWSDNSVDILYNCRVTSLSRAKGAPRYNTVYWEEYETSWLLGA